jgi:hypothetical protein
MSEAAGSDVDLSTVPVGFEEDGAVGSDEEQAASVVERAASRSSGVR